MTPCVFQFFDPEQQAFLDKQTQQYEEKLKKAPKTKNCALVVLKPDVVGAGKVDEILKKFKNHKFEVLHTQEWILEPQELEVLYKKDHVRSNCTISNKVRHFFH